jgi:hypothetical protein
MFCLSSAPDGPADAVAEKIARRLSHETGLAITPGQATLNWLRTKGIAVVTCVFLAPVLGSPLSDHSRAHPRLLSSQDVGQGREAEGTAYPVRRRLSALDGRRDRGIRALLRLVRLRIANRWHARPSRRTGRQDVGERGLPEFASTRRGQWKPGLRIPARTRTTISKSRSTRGPSCRSLECDGRAFLFCALRQRSGDGLREEQSRDYEARPPCSEPLPSVKVARPLPLPPARARPQPGAASVPLKQPAAA